MLVCARYLGSPGDTRMDISIASLQTSLPYVSAYGGQASSSQPDSSQTDGLKAISETLDMSNSGPHKKKNTQDMALASFQAPYTSTGTQPAGTGAAAMTSFAGGVGAVVDISA